MSSRSANIAILASTAEAFLKAGVYLRNWTPRTAQTYRQGLACLYQSVAEPIPTKASLDAWVIAMRERGLTPGGCNMYIRTVNSYLSWLHEEGHMTAALRVKVLRAPVHQKTLLSASDIRALLLFKPRTVIERRTWTLILLLLDTGVRVSEALNVERSRVNLDAMTLMVFGKGRKERLVPFSLELRKALFRWQTLPREHSSRLLFATRSGLPLTYRNAFRDVQRLCRCVGISKPVYPHLFRHQFAVTYIRQGGDIYRLSRLLGHTAVTTTQIYLRSMGIEDLRAEQERLTPLRLGA
jgi:integrase/recombinase XerD